MKFFFWNSFFVLFLLFLLRSSQGADRIIPHEPVSVIKSYLRAPSEDQLSLWRPLTESSGSTRDRLLDEMLKNIKHLVQSRAIVISLDGKVILENFPPQMMWNSTSILPNCNIVTLIASSLSILLEGHQPDVLFKELRHILISNKKLNVPESYHYMTLIDLISKLPEGIDRDSKTFNTEFNIRCHVALQVVNYLLGRSLYEAWHDAFMSLQLDESVLNEKGNLVVPFSNLYRLTEVIHSDLDTLPLLTEDESGSYDRSENYAFGWWMNAGMDGKRLLDTLPNDAIFSMSPTVQIFVIPSLKMSAVLVNNAETSWSARTYEEVLFSDNEIWRQILLIINPQYSEAYWREKEAKKRADGAGGDDNRDEGEKVDSSSPSSIGVILDWVFFVLESILGLFYHFLDFASSQLFVVRVLLWVGFISCAHYTVYLGFHFVWKTMTILFSRTHENRPKSGKTD